MSRFPGFLLIDKCCPTSFAMQPLCAHDDRTIVIEIAGADLATSLRWHVHDLHLLPEVALSWRVSRDET